MSDYAPTELELISLFLVALSFYIALSDYSLHPDIVPWPGLERIGGIFQRNTRLDPPRLEVKSRSRTGQKGQKSGRF
jgi:hypothetical protein